MVEAMEAGKRGGNQVGDSAEGTEAVMAVVAEAEVGSGAEEREAAV